MTHESLAKELNLRHPFLSITRTRRPSGDPAQTDGGCSLKLLARALEGEPLCFCPETLSCRGAATGFGFTDGIPDIPGGFGHFLSHGRGDGFPPGEHVKCSPETGEQMLLAQPQDVMGRFGAICVGPFSPKDEPDLVTALVNLDQLAALTHIFCYRKTEYDCVIAPMSSGCASVFRIPLGELKRGHPRAVIGNIDVFSRPHFPPETAFFTVSGADFARMLQDADESVLAAPIWSGVKKRLGSRRNGIKND